MSAHDAAERFKRGYGRKIPPPPFRHERPAQDEDEAPEPRRRIPSPKEIEPMYVADQPRGKGCVAESLFYVALIVVVLGFALWALLQTGILTSGQAVINLPTAVDVPRFTPHPSPLPIPTSPPPYQEPPAQQQPIRQEGDTAQQPVVAPLPAWSDDAGGPDLQLPAAPETHAADPFWTDAELAAFTATAVAFMDPGTLPTAEPAFVEYVNEQCADVDLVAKSPTLQLWCPSIVTEGD